MLTTNAIKYTYNGLIELRAERDYERHNSLKITVKDSGVGFTDEQKNKFLLKPAMNTSNYNTN